MSLFYWMREWTGVVFLIGLLVYIASFFVKGDESTAKAWSGSFRRNRTGASGPRFLVVILGRRAITLASG